MAIERQVILANIKKVKVKEFLSKELEKAGIGEIDIQRTPMDTRVIISAQRPGIVIGKKGLTIKSLTDILRNEYGLDNPQIEVNDLPVHALNARVMAKSIASSLERGFHFRRAAYSALRDIMNAGALGAQITISGKLTGERSRTEKFVDGYIKHCGEPAERLVLKGFAEAAPKLGRIGVKVKILPPGSKLPDDITIAGLSKEPEAIPAAAEAQVSLEAKPVEPAELIEEDIVDEKKLKEVIKPQVDFSEMSAKELLKAIKGMDKKGLSDLLETETTGKKRKTVIDGINKLREE